MFMGAGNDKFEGVKTRYKVAGLTDSEWARGSSVAQAKTW